MYNVEKIVTKHPGWNNALKHFHPDPSLCDCRFTWDLKGRFL
ncbi:hypothetical protein Nmel_014510 [Mimus melanotis]